MPRRPRVTPEQILDAATREFAERGFAGARVDRIARRAGVNKAMLYYHFRSKQTLYRRLLRRAFSQAGARIQRIADSDAPPFEQLDRVVALFADLIGEQRFFPAIMLREVAEGGAHLDVETLGLLAAVPGAFGRIVARGIAAGEFRDVNPLFAYFSMMSPIVFFLCAAPIRRELGARRLASPDIRNVAAFVSHVQANMRRVLAPDGAAGPRSTT
ncbi:MAG: TetR/AcrR family transcriptional regulator [Acidobacteria bacterium]|nr:TetR/AcrR family transcriptional regulator [Acidobacteriota bacterium]